MGPDASRSAARLPVVTGALVVAQVAVWLLTRRYLLVDEQWARFAVGPGDPRQPGLLLAPFLHLEPGHLAANLAVLWLAGAPLERTLGPGRFAALYLGCGWFASLVQWGAVTAFAPWSAGGAAAPGAVGSSGAVAGLLGAVAVRYPSARFRLPLTHRQVRLEPLLALWLLYTAARALAVTVGGTGAAVGHWAHFSGAVCGIWGAMLWRLHVEGRAEELARVGAEAALASNLVAASQAWTALLSLREGDLELRQQLVAARRALGDAEGALRLAREGIERPARAGKRDEALAAYRALALSGEDPGLSPGIRYRIGCWLAEAGELRDAVTALCVSVREETSPAAAAASLYRAGLLAAERLGAPHAARELWQRLVRQYPGTSWCTAAQEQLGRLPPVEGAVP
jgi:membrane associated rhomboid family serine protease